MYFFLPAQLMDEVVAARRVRQDLVLDRQAGAPREQADDGVLDLDLVERPGEEPRGAISYLPSPRRLSEQVADLLSLAQQVASQSFDEVLVAVIAPRRAGLRAIAAGALARASVAPPWSGAAWRATTGAEDCVGVALAGSGGGGLGAGAREIVRSAAGSRSPCGPPQPERP